MLARARSTRMFISGTDLYWEESGQGRPLVLLHGMSDSGHTFNRVAPLFAQRRRVIVPDLPGHGRSGRPAAPYDLAWFSSVLTRWTEEIGLSEYDLVGHSLGGGIAQYMLLQAGGRVRRLGLVATGGFGPQVAWPIRLASLPGILERVGQPFMSAGTALGVRLCGGRFSRHDRQHLCRHNARPGTARALGRTIRSVIDLRGQCVHFLDHAHRIGELPPVSVFWGERDPIIPVAHADSVADLLDGVSVTRFRCGHYPHRELPRAFVQAVERFLEEPQPTPVLRRAAPRSALRSSTRGGASMRGAGGHHGAAALPGITRPALPAPVALARISPK
jgi:pimeloyl-ACP methyl ester carboxylesterase